MRLKLLAWVEGVSFLVLLFITMPLKYYWHLPKPNMVAGQIHGILFILYILFLLQAWYAYQWSIKRVLLGLVASIVPFGTFFADKLLFTEQDH
jgi:integral membrane protein